MQQLDFLNDPKTIQQVNPTPLEAAINRTISSSQEKTMYQQDRKPLITNSKHYTTHWGRADQQCIWGQGIVQYWTPSHGGYEISIDRLLLMPAHLRACSFTGDHAFEEDCSWCAVPLAFPDCFPAEYVADAQRTYDSMYAGRHAAA